jgi:hypothetical protein
VKHSLSFWLVFAIAACVLVAPLFTIDVPPIVDYPNHLARLYITAHGSSDPWLSHMYKQQWAIIPNLGIDLLVPWTLSFLPLYLAGRIMLALTLLLPVIGTIAYHRALFGGSSFWPLSSFIVAYNLVFLLGFHNLLLSYGIALLSAVIFYKTMRGNAIINTVITAACAIVTFFTHIVGLALLIAIISVHKIFYIVESWPNSRRVGRAAFVQGCGFGIIVLGPLGLYLASPLAAAPIGNSWIGGIDKLKFLLAPVLNYCPALDLMTMGSLIVVFIVCMTFGRITISRQVCVLAVALFIAYPYLPFETKTTTFVDVRFVAFLGFLVFCLFTPRELPRTIIMTVSILLISLFLLRMGVVARVWYDQRQDLADLRHAIKPIEPGSRVLVVTVSGPGADKFMAGGDPALQPEAPKGRFLSIIGTPTYWYIAALVTIERHAFWPLLFSSNNKQPLEVLPPYQEISVSNGSLPLYQGLALDDIPTRELKDFPYVANWRSRFDYVLVLNAGVAGDLRNFLPDRLEYLDQTGFAALFRIKKKR